MTTSAPKPPGDLSALRINRDRPRRGGRGGLIIAALVVLAAAAGFLLLRKPPAVTVRVAPVEAEAVAGAGGGPLRVEVLTANGYVVPRLKAAVSSEVAGRLEALYVDEGDTAKAGQVLGVLNNLDLKAQLEEARGRAASARATRAEARANEVLARQEFERQKELLDRGLTAAAGLERAQSALDVAVAQAELANANIRSADAAVAMADETVRKSFIRAPFDGTILRKEAEVGEIVSPIPANGGLTRGAIVTMADLASSEMVVDVNEGYVTRVREGQPAEVELDAYSGVRFPAVVRQVVPTADRQKATVQVKVAFLSPDRRILPEMGGKVYFQDEAGGDSASAGGSSANTLVPLPAVRDVDGRSVVFVVKDGRAGLRPVQVQGSSGARARIVAGLAPGEMVVTEGAEKLKDGAQVRLEADRTP